MAATRISALLLTLSFAPFASAQSTTPAQSPTRATPAINARAASQVAASNFRTIYYNGNVFTSNERHLWAEGVVVDESVIVAVGTTQQVLAFTAPGATLVDLKGATMIPGFNDAHVHPFDGTLFPRAAVLNAATDFLPNAGPS